VSRGEDKRLRATFVLLGALLIEIYWLKFTVVPDFVKLYTELGQLPKVTAWVFGWTPYLIARSLAPAMKTSSSVRATRNAAMGRTGAAFRT
jgi:type II secretory pathway component PulF